MAHAETTAGVTAALKVLQAAMKLDAEAAATAAAARARCLKRRKSQVFNAVTAADRGAVAATGGAASS